MTALTELLDQIRHAVADDADDSTRQRGADACRAIRAALDAAPGSPLAEPPPPSSPLATAARQLSQVPPSLALDALIGKLRSLLPEEADASPPPGAPQLRIPFIQLPRRDKPHS